jgi:hypothetical protein
VIEHNQEDGDRAQTFDVRAERAIGRLAAKAPRLDWRRLSEREPRLNTAGTSQAGQMAEWSIEECLRAKWVPYQ